MNNIKIKDIHKHSGNKESKRKSKKKVSSSESKRKLKTQSLIVPTIVSEDNNHDDDDDNRTHPTAEHLERCPSPGGGGGKSCFSQRIRSFRRFRSLSKSRDDGSSISGGSNNSSSSCEDPGDEEHHHEKSNLNKTSLYPTDSMTKSSSLIDLKSLCSKLHRHFKSTGLSL